MNLYQVTVRIGGMESASLIIARSREQARYMHWKEDDGFTGKVRDMPNFRVKLLKNNVWKNKVGFVTDVKKYQKYWR